MELRKEADGIAVRIGLALLASALSGVLGTASGGALSTLFNLRGRNALGFLLAGAGGVMISISLMELVPEAIQVGGKAFSAAGLVAGALVLFALDVVLPHAHSARGHPAKERGGPHTHRPGGGQGGRHLRGPSHRDHGYSFGYRYECGGQNIAARHGLRRSRLKKMGVLIGLGIALHNVPEGLAIGAAYAHEPSLGLGVALLIALQNIPEGTAMAVPLGAAGVPARNVLALTATAGLPMALGALAGVLLGSISPTILSFALGFAAGAMMYIVGDELLPEAHEYGTGHYPTLGLVAGLFVGVVAGLLTP